LHTWCGLSANLGCSSETCCIRLVENTGRKKSPSGCHRTTLSGYIFIINITMPQCTQWPYLNTSQVPQFTTAKVNAAQLPKHTKNLFNICIACQRCPTTINWPMAVFVQQLTNVFQRRISSQNSQQHKKIQCSKTVHYLGSSAYMHKINICDLPLFCPTCIRISIPVHNYLLSNILLLAMSVILVLT